RDILNSGFSTMLSAFCGGLPVITVIARTSVNINHGAKTTWSNFFHGLFCLLAIGLFGKWFENIPLAALSAILLFTGYKLASPKVFRDSYLLGIEQIIILLTTILVTLGTGSIPFGILMGIAITLIIHLVRTGMSWQTFLKYLLWPKLKVVKDDKTRYLIRVKGIANFFNVFRLRRTLNRIPKNVQLVMDFSNARLVDYTALEFLHDYQFHYNKAGGNFEILGIDAHESSSSHPYSLHIHKPERLKRLTKRQMHLEFLAHKNGWHFNHQMNWEIDRCKEFHFFDTRPVEYKKNTISGKFDQIEICFEISDITFDEGALLATEVYRSTMQIIDLPFNIPSFIMEREHMMDRILELASGGDIDFSDHKKFSKKVLLHSNEADEVREFFTKELLDFFASHTIYHIESTGSSLLLFQNFRLASVEMVKGMIEFSRELTTILYKIKKQRAQLSNC
ncbi:MAG: SulP family inorganic anion transporter, partial [Bacteroidetes bacterium]|nr:SulP family inorganic anion transporter [Bacteroidota bacterium]